MRHWIIIIHSCNVVCNIHHLCIMHFLHFDNLPSNIYIFSPQPIPQMLILTRVSVAFCSFCLETQSVTHCKIKAVCASFVVYELLFLLLYNEWIRDLRYPVVSYVLHYIQISITIIHARLLRFKWHFLIFFLCGIRWECNQIQRGALL